MILFEKVSLLNLFSGKEALREVVFERKLDFHGVVVVEVRVITRVVFIEFVFIFPRAELKFDARHHVLGGVVQQVHKSIVAHLESIVRLTIGIIHVEHRIADGSAEFIAPVVVYESGETQHWYDGSFDFAIVFLINGHVNRSVVHIVLDACAIHYATPKCRGRAEFQIGSQVQTPAQQVLVERIADAAFHSHAAYDTGKFDITSRKCSAVFRRKVGHRKTRTHASECDTVGIVALVGAGAGAFERDSQARVTLNGHIAYLHVAEKRHPVGSPVLDGIGEHVDVHERAPVLACAEFAQLAIGVAQANGRLAGIDTCAEHFELKMGLEFAQRCLEVVFHTETRLTNTEEEVAVAAVIIFIDRKFCRTHDIEPFGGNPTSIIAGVHHGETVDFHGFSSLFVLRVGIQSGATKHEEHE